MAPWRDVRLPGWAVPWLAMIPVGLAVVWISLLELALSKPRSLDDAFIVFVYAKHLLATGSFYWNAQEGSVDGFTSLLDVIAKAFATLLYGGRGITAGFWATVVCHAGAALAGSVVVFHLARGRLLHRAILAATAGLAIASNPSLGFASSFLLEGPLVALGVVTACGLVMRDRWSRGTLVGLGTALVALSLTRPELVPISAGFAAFFAHQQRELRLHQRLLPLYILASVLLVYFTWHWRVFGYLAPNTYFAKASDSRWSEIHDGWNYVSEFARNRFRLGLLFMICLAPALSLGRWEGAAWRWRYLLVSSTAIVALGMIIVSGGDCYVGSRFFVLPIILFLVAISVAAARQQGWYRAVPSAILGIVAIASVQGVVRKIPEAIAAIRMWPVSEADFSCEIEATTTLAHALPHTAWVQYDFQRAKYFQDEVVIVDGTGLSNQSIAHLPAPGQVLWGKGDAWRDFRLRPEVWFIGFHFMSSVPATTYDPEDMASNPDVQHRLFGYGLPRELGEQIKDSYRLASVRACDQYMNVLLRNDVAARLGDNDHVMVSNASTAPGRSTDAAAAARHPPVDSNDDVR
jgi:hypothetical protein